MNLHNNHTHCELFPDVSILFCRIDEANGSAMMAEIIKGHPNLLLRLGVFFPKYSVNKHKV